MNIIKPDFYWNFKEFDSRIGSFYTFLIEVKVRSHKGSILLLDNVSEKHYSLVQLIDCIIPNIQVYQAEHKVEYDLRTSWPKPIDKQIKNSTNGSFIYLAKYHKTEIANIFQTKTENNNSLLNISVHLKNNPNETIGNANRQHWKEAIKLLLDKEDISLTLIGNEKYDFMPSHPNVHVLSTPSVEHSFNAVISSDAFVGMASAFATAAILSGKPYRVWKHPNHHPKEMREELDKSGQFPFRTKNQKLVTEFENADSIVSETCGLIKGVFECWR